ncbi:MAG: phosphate ABC transporter ATP-binding protein [Thermoleophilia bacterium]
MGVPLLEMAGVSLRRGDRTVLRDIDLTVPAEGITVLVGPSGSGKSSLLRLANRLEAPDDGVVRVLGEDVAAIDPLALRRRVGMVFQRPTPFAGTVRDNLRVAAPGAGPAELAEALARAGLDDRFLEREATRLSGGEAQRMCLARALAAGPRALLMDEPTSALDADAGAVVERTGRALADAGVPMIWVTHDLGQAARIADHVVRLAEGRIVAVGPAAAQLSAGGAPDGG